MANKMRIPKHVARQLLAAYNAAFEAADPASPGCSVAPAHREALRAYLRTWVLAPLSAALCDLNVDAADLGPSVKDRARVLANAKKGA